MTVLICRELGIWGKTTERSDGSFHILLVTVEVSVILICYSPVQTDHVLSGDGRTPGLDTGAPLAWLEIT